MSIPGATSIPESRVSDYDIFPSNTKLEKLSALACSLDPLFYHLWAMLHDG